MASSDDLLEEARRKRAEQEKKDAAREAAAKKARRRGRPAKLKVDDAEIERRKKQAEANRKKQQQEQVNIAATKRYQSALAKAKAAADKASRTSSPEDLSAYERAKSALQSAGAEYTRVTGKPAESAPRVVTVPVRGVPGGKTVVSGDKGLVTGKADAGAVPPRITPKGVVPRGAAPVEGRSSTATTSASALIDPNKPMPSDTMLARLMAANPTLSREQVIARYQAQFADDTKTDGGGGGGGGTRSTQTQTSITQYSAQQLQAAATDAAQRAIGRAFTAKELARLTKYVNDLEKKNPTVTSQTTTSSKGSSTTSSKTRGGVDEVQAMQSWAERNPEYAGYQKATTYFDAMLNSLRGPAGGSF